MTLDQGVPSSNSVDRSRLARDASAETLADRRSERHRGSHGRCYRCVLRGRPVSLAVLPERAPGWEAHTCRAATDAIVAVMGSFLRGRPALPARAGVGPAG